MKISFKMIALIAVFTISFAAVTMQDSQANARSHSKSSGNSSSSFSGLDLGSGR